MGVLLSKINNTVCKPLYLLRSVRLAPRVMCIGLRDLDYYAFDMYEQSVFYYLR